MSFATQPENAPIHDLQTMLRTVLPEQALGRDGIYGTETKETVKAFQRSRELPESGVADGETWNAIVEAFKVMEPLRAPAEPLQIVLQPYQVIPLGSENLHVFLIQGMLNALGKLYIELPVLASTGILDAPTAEALRFIQNRAGLEETGELDKLTWKNLTHQYRTMVGDGTGRFPIRRVQRTIEEPTRQETQA